MTCAAEVAAAVVETFRSIDFPEGDLSTWQFLIPSPT